MYLHRYLRLTPILAMAIIVYMTILPRMGDGPLYGSVTFDDYTQCERTWFWTLLYVQNYATHEIVGSPVKPSLTWPYDDLSLVFLAVSGPFLVLGCGHAAVHHRAPATDRPLQVGQEGGRHGIRAYAAPGGLSLQHHGHQRRVAVSSPNLYFWGGGALTQ